MTWTFVNTHIDRFGSLQYWTAPHEGVYKITAKGAGGAGNSGGRGAIVTAWFWLDAGAEIEILVGQRELSSISGNGGMTGGGGGSFVCQINPQGLDDLLLAAGGGAGAGYWGDVSDAPFASMHGSTSPTGDANPPTNAGGASGQFGVGGANGREGRGGGGGGFLSSGGSGQGYLQGGAGGDGFGGGAIRGPGGFGGGGSGWSSTGGGGGFSGGGGGDRSSINAAGPTSNEVIHFGGGGGSYIQGYSRPQWSESATFTVASSLGHGLVEIQAHDAVVGSRAINLHGDTRIVLFDWQSPAKHYVATVDADGYWRAPVIPGTQYGIYYLSNDYRGQPRIEGPYLSDEAPT